MHNFPGDFGPPVSDADFGTLSAYDHAAFCHIDGFMVPETWEAWMELAIRLQYGFQGWLLRFGYVGKKKKA